MVTTADDKEIKRPRVGMGVTVTFKNGHVTHGKIELIEPDVICIGTTFWKRPLIVSMMRNRNHD